MKRLLYVLILVGALIVTDFSIAQGEDLPDSSYVSGVYGRAQSYSLSCESRSAVDLAAYWGLNIGETELLEAMPESDNPDQGFVGNPNEVWGRLPPHGYGVHAEPVAETLRDFGLQAEAYSGLGWDDLRSEISAGHPVIVWVIGQMWNGTSVDYEASDGSSARVAAFEHTMILTGYSADSVQVIDAYSGMYQYYWLSAFRSSWAVLGNMAVFASNESNDQEETTQETHGNTYTVQRGDYLVALAEEFGTTWQELAELNSIGYPFIIYTGQVLELPGEEAQGSDNESEPEPIPEPTPEPTPVRPVFTIKKVNGWARIPIILQNTIPLSSVSTASVTSTPEPVKTVIVLNSDTLIGFGRSIGVAWHILAMMNNLPPTHIVHPGEILKVK